MEENKLLDTQNLSAFNDAVLSIRRLNDSWLLCKKFIRQGLFKNWKTELDNIWLELYPDICKVNKGKDLISENLELMKKISATTSQTEYYFSLLKRHEFLRLVQENAGKGTVYKEEDEGL